MRLYPIALVMVGLALTSFAQAEDIKAPVVRVATTSTTLITVAPTPTPTTPSTGAGGVNTGPSTVPTHTIAVGATGFNFSPNNLTNVAVGSIIEFNFYPGNHSVVRSAYKFPCIPYEDTGPNRVGFFSGFLNTDVYSSDGPKYRVRVNDSDPIFYYCSAPGSCITHGMLGVINPNSTWTLEIQEEYAANTTIQLTPGEPLPSEMAPTTVAATSGPTATGSSPSPSSSSSGLSGGAIAGIVLGTLAGIITLVGLGIFFFCCLRRNSRWQQRRHRRLRSGQSGSMDGGGQGGMGDNAAMLSPLSPTARHGSTPGPGGPNMSDMSDTGGYFTQVYYRHRTPPLPPVPQHNPYSGTPAQQMMAHNGGHMQFHRPYHYAQSSLQQQQLQQQQQRQAYASNLPIYSSMATMSPLQSHPTTAYSAVMTAAPSPFTDKDYYGTPPIPTPTPTPPQHQHQHQQPAPVELPTAVATSVPAPPTSSDAGLRPPPPPPPPVPRIESPTIGGMEGTWGKYGDEAGLTQI